MKTNLFEHLLLWLYRNRITFEITTGIVYGHKMYKTSGYTFTDLGDYIMIQSDDGKFNYKAYTTEEVEKLLKAIG